MERPDFITGLREACEDLREHFDDDGAAWLTDVVPPATSDQPEKRGVEYLFELLCYFALIRGLKQRGVKTIRLVRAPGSTGFRFPYAPGAKENFAFFRFEWEGKVYDACAGTEIRPPGALADDPNEAPDISLQYVNTHVGSDNREPGHVIALWDAKHHKNSMSKADENQLLRWCTLFPRTWMQGQEADSYYRPGDLLEKMCPDAFQVSCILTNARATPFSSTNAYRYGYSFVFEFDGSLDTARPNPTRKQHYKGIRPRSR